MKPLRTLYLIASETGFRMLMTHEPDLAEIDVKAAHYNLRPAEGLVAEHSRQHSGPGSAGYAEMGSDHHIEEARGHFAHDIVAALGAEWASGLHDRIILAAGPKMLGELRSVLPKELHAHVASELHKDLINTPLHEMRGHFVEVPEFSEEAEV